MFTTNQLIPSEFCILKIPTKLTKFKPQLKLPSLRYKYPAIKWVGGGVANQVHSSSTTCSKEIECGQENIWIDTEVAK